ncbi:hypothetical protein D9M68_786770 [compost metagenome]
MAVVRRLQVEGFVRNIPDQVRENLEVGRAAGNIQVAGQIVGLARIGDLGVDEIIETANDAVGHRVQQLDALLGLQLGPGAAQRGLGGPDRRVDLGVACLVHAADQAVVDRIPVVESVAGGDPLAVDEVAEIAHCVLGCDRSASAASGSPAVRYSHMRS